MSWFEKRLKEEKDTELVKICWKKIRGKYIERKIGSS